MAEDELHGGGKQVYFHHRASGVATAEKAGTGRRAQCLVPSPVPARPIPETHQHERFQRRESPIATQAPSQASAEAEAATSETDASAEAGRERDANERKHASVRLLTQPPSKFDPIEGVDYGWVVKMAEKAHEQTLTSYRRVDDKAAAILTYLGAGTGLITLGSVSSAVVGQADFLLVLACIPSAVCGMVAMAFAAIGRRAGWVLHVPLPHHIAALAEWHDDPGAAEAEMIGKYGQCIEHNQKAVVKKAGWVNSAMWAFVVGIACLAIPVGQVLYAKSTAPTATTQK